MTMTSSFYARLLHTAFIRTTLLYKTVFPESSLEDSMKDSIKDFIKDSIEEKTVTKYMSSWQRRGK